MLERAIRSNYARQLSLMLVVFFMFVSNVSSITVDFAETTSSGEVVSSVKFDSDISGSDMSPSISPSEWLKNIGALDEGIHIRYDNPAGPILYGDYIAKPNPDDFTSDSDPYIEIAVTPDGKKWYLENPWSSSWDSAKEPTDGSVVNVPPPLLEFHKKADDGSEININNGEPFVSDELALIKEKLTETAKNNIREKIVQELLSGKYKNAKYDHTGNNRFGPKTFDCSGLVDTIRKENKLSGDLKADTTWMYKNLDRTFRPKKGDLIYFNTDTGKQPGHMGIVTALDKNGNVQKFTSALFGGVQESKITDNKYSGRKTPTWKDSIAGFTTLFSPDD